MFKLSTLLQNNCESKIKGGGKNRILIKIYEKKIAAEKEFGKLTFL